MQLKEGELHDLIAADSKATFWLFEDVVLQQTRFIFEYKQIHMVF